MTSHAWKQNEISQEQAWEQKSSREVTIQF
jgi:hypothetical protein